MQADVDAHDQTRTSSLPEKRAGVERPAKLIECPFEVRIDGAAHDQFYDVATLWPRLGRPRETSAAPVSSSQMCRYESW